jgi:DNA-binding response OmpR family regulator
MIKVLCIDDEADIRQLLVEELSEAGLSVIEAENGQEGLQKIISEWPDIVICDVSMPVMNGHELMAEIQINHPEFSNIPFIMLTAMADRQNMIMGLESGVDDYITKPLDLELLVAKVRGCANRIQNSRVANAPR